jgi:hypothetical protein
VKRLPVDVFIAVLIGPAQELARQRLAGRSRTPLLQAGPALAEAAWQSVRETLR